MWKVEKNGNQRKVFMFDTESQFGLLGTAIDHGQEKPGVDKAYEHLKQVGFWKELSEKSNFRNFGDMENQTQEKPTIALSQNP